jgi:Tfp pilus assembly protein PilV
MRAHIRSRLAALRLDGGFGLVELLVAMTVLVIGIFGLFSLYATSAVTARRASQTMTAVTLAETKLETFRAVQHGLIGNNPVALAAADSVYVADPAYSADGNVAVTGSSFVPTQIATGADGRHYRVDTYVVSKSVTATRNVKQVTVVVRLPANSRTLARISSLFDQASG